MKVQNLDKYLIYNRLETAKKLKKKEKIMIIRNHILLSQTDNIAINSNVPANNGKETEMVNEDHSDHDSDMNSDDDEVLAHVGRGE